MLLSGLFLLLYLTPRVPTDATFLTLEQSGYFDYSSIGGIKNNEASGVTGDVKVTLPACTAGDTATITCEWIKVY